MRRLLTFDCEGALLGATLDTAGGETGIVLVTGGSQTRVGSHRMFERLAKSLSEQGIACLRYDRRGVGDSASEDPGFRGSAPDLTAAAALLRTEIPGLRQVHGLGLCDGATAIALFGDEARLDGLILLNPWLVEAASGEPPPAAIKRHYRERLMSLEGWRRIFSGSVDYRKLLKGVRKIASRGPASALAADVAAALDRHRLPVQLILAAGDATAIAAEIEMKSPTFKHLGSTAQKIDSDSHTFARPGDEAALLSAVLEAVRQLERG